MDWFKNSWKVLLSPFSWLWEWIYIFRRFLYTYDLVAQNQYRVPIISVGNLTFGGTGKTPFTLWLSEYLSHRQNKKIMILMRGYKGKLEHSSGILHADSRLGFSPFEYGDEALLYARRLKDASIVVGKNRSQNLDYYFHKELPDVVLLDDGHQHLKLGRNLNIVLFDATMPLTRYKVAPMGYMREGFSALKDADLIVLGRVDQVSPEKLNDLRSLVNAKASGAVPIAEVYYSLSGLFTSDSNEMMDLELIRGKNVICIAAIASPGSFFSMVKDVGANVIEEIAFPDHHFFTYNDLNEILARAEEQNAFVITTEKDMVKIRRIINDERIMYFEIQICFASGEQKAREIIDRCVNFDL
jgi:tetraacyldisaccharide 4'-kinase